MSAKPQKSKTPRQALLARVHIAKKALGLDSDTYCAMLENSFNVTSSKDLPLPKLGEFANALEREVRKKVRTPSETPIPKSKEEYPGRPRNMGPMAMPQRYEVRDERAQRLQHIEAMLMEKKRLEDRQEVPWAYADALAKRICKRERVAWVETHMLYKIQAALRSHVERLKKQAGET